MKRLTQPNLEDSAEVSNFGTLREDLVTATPEIREERGSHLADFNDAKNKLKISPKNKSIPGDFDPLAKKKPTNS